LHTVRRDAVRAKAIAFVSDTHFAAADGSDVPARLLEALAGIDLIVHLGHIGAPAGLRRLEEAAPVLAVETSTGAGKEYERTRYESFARLIELPGLKIGAVHDFAGKGIKARHADGRITFAASKPVPELLVEEFGEAVDLVAYGKGHTDIVTHKDGVMFFNPGSPTQPRVSVEAAGGRLRSWRCTDRRRRCGSSTWRWLGGSQKGDADAGLRRQSGGHNRRGKRDRAGAGREGRV
jgi:putative phosphoesterase